MNVLKKLIIFLGIFIMCLGFAACSVKEKGLSNDLMDEKKQQSQAPKSQTPKSQTPDPQAPSDEAPPDPTGSDPMSLPPYTYDIEGRNWNVEGITVKYPMIVNSNIQEKSDEANDLIMNDMSTLIEIIKKNVNDETLTVDGVFDYSQISPTVLSICYEIDYYAESLAYPVSLYHTLTISLDQVAAIPLSDLFVIDETFVEDFKTMWMYAPFRDLDLEASGVNIKEEIEKLYSNKELIKLFSQANAQYYLIDQGLILSIEVPHALGDHLEMATKYEFLEIYMKKDHPLWKDYMFLGGDGFEGTNEGELYTIDKNIKVGDILTITLNENLSTGYSWQYAIEDDEVVSFKSDYVLENGGTDDGVSAIVGTGSQHEWNFKGLMQGSTAIGLDYLRSWEDRGTEAQTITYIITVE
ncbi:protease inhibitor I42 family protein [Petroclostridium sp. X23]|uniref:protease inhibitor I42 family protein n=1 Tax=Petroclostridium sp. X23 TaxID=3045146 RepID=UPI0024AC9E0E|nr:protease inhibitor I42 family protein [Petroclostridium sp. X23]WHH57750.1 protease inhibitor I42 family protein [Petroclostridium sp. X23]